MSLKNVAARPPRCVLVNMATGEEKECLFNPEQLAERVQVNWGRAAVQGLSHQPLQYGGTSNRVLPGLEFYLDKIFAAEVHHDPDILDFRHFLMAFTVARAGSDTVAHNAPPRLLFIWPGVLTVECVVLSVEFRYSSFAADGGVLRYTAGVELEEVLDERVTSEDLRRGGAVTLGVVDLTV